MAGEADDEAAAGGGEIDGVLVLSVWGAAERAAGDPAPFRARVIARPPLPAGEEVFYASRLDEVLTFVRRWLDSLTIDGR